MTTALDRTLADVLHGDVAAVVELEAAAPEDLAVIAHGGHPVLGAGAVARVLTRFMEGETSSADAQRWAALMRWGHLAGRSDGPDIDYEPGYEDAIVEAVARLDELGDLIDGEISPAQAEELLRHLR